MSDRRERDTTKMDPIKRSVAVELDLEDPKSVAGFFEELAEMLKISTKLRVTVDFPDEETPVPRTVTRTGKP